jgi:small-conductance mechanosensitive channel/CRP-like cAMP-binding protein
MTDSHNGNAICSRRNLVAPTLLLIGSGVSWQFSGPLGMTFSTIPGSTLARIGSGLPIILLVTALTLLGIRLTYLILAHRLGSTPPRLMRQIIAVGAWTVNGGILAASLFEVPLGSLVTTSGMMVAVIGIALKNMISDLFTGLSLPVKLGDWIEVDGSIGRVIEVGWRATRLVTTNEVTVIIPNSHLTAKPFRNFSQPGTSFRDSFRITLPSTVTVYQAERNLTAAARQVDMVAAMPVPPDVRIAGFNDRGVEWEVRYFVPNYDSASGVRFRIQRNLMRNLHFSGIALPAKMIELHQLPAAQSHAGCEELTFLSSIEMFDGLTPDELSAICARMTRRLVHAGTPVVRQADTGDSLFVLKEGLLRVSIHNDGIDTIVGQISPGQFFGEMSLLTGAPRSATVQPVVDCMIYEISRNTMLPIMQNRPEIAEQMSHVLALRQLANAPMMNAQGKQEEAKESLTRQLLGRIRAFFTLIPEPVV